MSGEDLPIYVFLDAQVYYAASFDFQSPRFASLKECVNRGTLHLVSTDIVAREVQRGVGARLAEFRSSLGKSRKLGGMLRSLGDVRIDALEALAKRPISIDDALGVATDFFRDYTESIPIPPNALGQMFDMYFSGNAPFGPADKKNEFPDAANLTALLSFSQSMNMEIYVVSGDDDWQRTCASHSKLVHVRHLSEVLDKAIRGEWLDKDLMPTAELLTILRSQCDALKAAATSALSSASTVEYGDGNLDDLVIDHLWCDEFAITDVHERGKLIDIYGELFISIHYLALISLEDDEMLNTIEGEQSGQAELSCNVALELTLSEPKSLKVISVDFDDGLILRMPLKY